MTGTGTCATAKCRAAFCPIRVAAAMRGQPCFFLGTDSAPHARRDKESACGCAGIYTAHAAIELYAEVFEQACALNRLEAFASFHSPDFYGLPRNTGQITLDKTAWTVRAAIPFGDDVVVPFRAGEQIPWRLTELADESAPNQSPRV